ncbi:MAG: ATP-binding cassette domain-containing protein, partial [Candidatus Promineifilaceae bacterium]
YHEARRRLLDVYSLGSNAQKLAPAEVASITGLGPAVAVGQNLLNCNPNSTLATASGLHPFFRLLFARFGERSCARCGTALTVLTNDAIIHRLATISANEAISLYAPLVRQAVGSHRTLLDLLKREFGGSRILVDGRRLSDSGIDKATLPAFDPAAVHDIDVELAVRTSNIPPAEARRVIELARGLGAQAISVRGAARDQILSWTPACPNCGLWFDDLEPVHFRSRCPHCKGAGCSICQDTGMLPGAAAVRWSGLRLPDLLGLSAGKARKLFDSDDIPETAVRLKTEITKRLDALITVGLGYLTLNRSSPTLSRGEAQRVRLAIILTSKLEDMVHILDEPTIGQHPADVSQLLEAMRELPGPVIYVEHDRVAAAAADEALDLGPGAGKEGGQVEYQGSPPGLWEADTATGRFFSKREHVQIPVLRPDPKDLLVIRAASKHNLRDIDVRIPLSRLTVVTGVSGSGKSTLVEDVLATSLSAKKPVGCLSVEGPVLKTVVVDQKPIGRNPRSNPATYTKLSDVIRDLFAVTSGLSPSHFSFNRTEGACQACNGMGAVEVRMRYLPSTWIPCAVCDGRRFSEEIINTRISIGDGMYSIDEIYALPISEVRKLLAEGNTIAGKVNAKADRILAALSDVGLGYLPLGQPSPSLSGGEAQRVKLAKYLGRAALSSQLLILDEPTTGLHPQDIAGLLVVLDRLVRSGATVVMVEHNLDAIQAADWVIDLGPGAGPDGGRLLYDGPLKGIYDVKASATRRALVVEEEAGYPETKRPARGRGSSTIAIRGARANNLDGVDADIPKGAITVVTGVSGSGKSSLVSDILEVEARRRYLESLSLYERQGLKEGPEAAVDELTGLGVAIAIGSERRLQDPRATVGTATEIAHHLAVLMTWYGTCRCKECGNMMVRGQPSGGGVWWSCDSCQDNTWVEPRSFSPTTYGAACQKCSGVGSLQIPNPDKLIRHPGRTLCGGAMYSPGFFPKGYLCKPFNNGYDMVRALGTRYGFDPAGTPWNEMTDSARQAFLFGDPDPMEVLYQTRSRSFTRMQAFPGFYGFIRDWDIGGTYTDRIVCPQCDGARLRPEFLTITLNGHNIHELNQMPLDDLIGVLNADWEVTQPASPKTNGRGLAISSRQTIERRLRFLSRVGLGYLHLLQPTSTISAGEAQRIKLAGLMGSGLTSLTVLLDEPTRGMHPREVEGLLAALKEMRDDGNTVIVVEHEEQIMRSADYLLDLGPGSGSMGGEIVASGTPEAVAVTNTTTARWLRGDRNFDLRRARRVPERWMSIREPRANNLKGEDVKIPLDVLIGVCGVSGSGKSTLIIDILGRAIAPKKHTTSVASEQIDPGRHGSIEGAPTRALVVDQAKAGLVSPASFLDLDRPLRVLFAAGDDAAAKGITEKELRRSCSSCNGRGVDRIDMGFLPPVYSTCESCRGTGYLAEAWEIRRRGYSLPELSSMTLDDVFQLFGDVEALAISLSAALSVGVGYLVLHQPGRTLSGGEAQRLKIAREMKKKTSSPTLYLLDEPTVGQHLEDVLRLNQVLHQLIDAGHGALVVEHHPHLLASCDWLIELGPGGGPDGGRIIATGTPDQLAMSETPTSPYLREVLERSSE